MEITAIINRNFSNISSEYRQFAIKKDLCRSCGLYDNYKQVVQSEGSTQDPTFMFIGEAPGKDESEQSRPFIGRAGQRLRDELRKHPKTFSRKNTIISNVLACRPEDNQFPKKSNGPYLTESGQVDDIALFCYQNWLLKEIGLLKPKVIVVLGSNALNYVWGSTLSKEEMGSISNLRGAWKFLPRYKAWSMATFHPSYVLRCQNDKNSYVPMQFEQDINKIAQGWKTIIANDKRMSLSNHEWKKQLALEQIESFLHA